MRKKFAGRIAHVIQDSVHSEQRHPINPGIAATALVAMIERFCYFWVVYRGPFPREGSIDTLAAIWYQAIFGVDPAEANLVVHDERYEHLGAVRCFVRDLVEPEVPVPV